MATATPSWNSCRLRARWVTQNGLFLEGSWRVIIPVRITNAQGDVIVPAGEFGRGELATGSAANIETQSLDVQVPATMDLDNLPNNFPLTVEIQFYSSGVANETYYIKTPVDGDVNLRSVALPSTIPTTSYPMLGVAGGVALLDAEGYVVNADGSRPQNGTGGGGTGEIPAEYLTQTEGDARYQLIGNYQPAGDYATRSELADYQPAGGAINSLADIPAGAPVGSFWVVL